MSSTTVCIMRKFPSYLRLSLCSIFFPPLLACVDDTGCIIPSSLRTSRSRRSTTSRTTIRTSSLALVSRVRFLSSLPISLSSLLVVQSAHMTIPSGRQSLGLRVQHHAPRLGYLLHDIHLHSHSARRSLSPEFVVDFLPVVRRRTIIFLLQS